MPCLEAAASVREEATVLVDSAHRAFRNEEGQHVWGRIPEAVLEREEVGSPPCGQRALHVGAWLLRDDGAEQRRSAVDAFGVLLGLLLQLLGDPGQLAGDVLAVHFGPGEAWESPIKNEARYGFKHRDLAKAGALAKKQTKTRSTMTV